MQYAYERARVVLRNPSIVEDALLVNVESWQFHTAARFPATRATPACDAILRARFITPPTFTRLALSV